MLIERRKIMNRREIIQKSLDYIENNLKAEITADELCRAAGYSYAHYCKIFKAFVGMPPAQYITRRKLIHAVYDIANGTVKIDSALRYGFETYAGFYKAFKNEYGCSPSEFTKRCKGEKPYRINILEEEHILISKKEIKKILSGWDINYGDISNVFSINTGRQNENTFYVGNDYVIKYTPDLMKIKNNIAIAKALSNEGFESSLAVKTVYGTDYLQSGELYFFLTKRISGCPLKCSYIYKNPARAFKIGESIAKLHIALNKIDKRDYPEADFFGDFVSSLEKIKGFVSLPNGFAEKLSDNLQSLYDSLPQQLIHRDINPSNILIRNEVFCGFIDFDLAEVNVKIFDICYAATSILSETFSNDTVNNDEWLTIFKNIIVGYNRVNHLSDEEMKALPYVVYAIQTVCIAFFSKSDKYKDLCKTNIDMLGWLIEKLPL